jgi:hypothetical protein
MTKEQIENSGEFRITKKLLKRKYPFIKDIHFDDTNVNFKTLYPLVATIDPFEFAKIYGFTIHPLEIEAMNYLDEYLAPDFAWLVVRGDGANARKIQKELDQDIKGVHNSPAVPDEYRLDKELYMTKMYVDKNSIPQDMRN